MIVRYRIYEELPNAICNIQSFYRKFKEYANPGLASN